jgi:hypothetical protein
MRRLAFYLSVLSLAEEHQMNDKNGLGRFDGVAVIRRLVSMGTLHRKFRTCTNRIAERRV